MRGGRWGGVDKGSSRHLVAHIASQWWRIGDMRHPLALTGGAFPQCSPPKDLMGGAFTECATPKLLGVAHFGNAPPIRFLGLAHITKCATYKIIQAGPLLGVAHGLLYAPLISFPCIAISLVVMDGVGIADPRSEEH